MGRLLRPGRRPGRRIWTTSGWDAALTAALGLAAWVAFAITWAVPAARSLGARGPLARAALCLLCGAVPVAWVGLPVDLNLIRLASTRADGSWRAAGFAAALASVLTIGAAQLITLRARRAARERLALAPEPAPARELPVTVDEPGASP